jgi:hypothetical protein
MSSLLRAKKKKRQKRKIASRGRERERVREREMMEDKMTELDCIKHKRHRNGEEERRTKRQASDEGRE